MNSFCLWRNKKKMSDLLRKHNISDRATWRKWILKNHPDKGGDSETFAIVKNDYEKYIVNKENIPQFKHTSNNPFPPGSGNYNMFFKFQEQMKQHRNANSFYTNLFSETSFGKPIPRKACYNNYHGIWCQKSVEQGKLFCKNCEKEKCNYLIKDQIYGYKKQCSLKKRHDDIYCSKHSSKPPLEKKEKKPVIQCAHIKKNGEQCKTKSKDEYCFRHIEFHKI